MLIKITDSFYIDSNEIAKFEIFKNEDETIFAIHIKYKNASLGSETVRDVTKEQIDGFLFKIEAFQL